MQHSSHAQWNFELLLGRAIVQLFKPSFINNANLDVLLNFPARGGAIYAKGNVTLESTLISDSAAVHTDLLSSSQVEFLARGGCISLDNGESRGGPEEVVLRIANSNITRCAVTSASKGASGGCLDVEAASLELFDSSLSVCSARATMLKNPLSPPAVSSKIRVVGGCLAVMGVSIYLFNVHANVSHQALALIERTTLQDCIVDNQGPAAGGGFVLAHSVHTIMRQVTVDRASAHSSESSATGGCGAISQRSVLEAYETAFVNSEVRASIPMDSLSGGTTLDPMNQGAASVGALNQRAASGGALYLLNAASVLLYNASLMLNNSAVTLLGAPHPFGRHGVWVQGGYASYTMPAPPGFWLPNSKCIVSREECDQANVELREQCEAAVEVCETIPQFCDNRIDGEATMVACASSRCMPATFVQSCDWLSNPSLLGTSSVLFSVRTAYGSSFPYPCSPGLRGGSEPEDQAGPSWCPPQTNGGTRSPSILPQRALVTCARSAHSLLALCLQ